MGLSRVLGAVASSGLLALSASPAAAGPDEAQIRFFLGAAQLVSLCSHADGTPESDQCAGFLMGVADTEQQRLQFTGRAYFCRVSTFSVGHLRDLVIAYARAHPERMDLGAANLATFALQGAFPCPPGVASD